MTKFSILICSGAILLSCRAKNVPLQQEKPKPEQKKTELPQKKDTVAQKGPVKNTTYNFMLFLPVDLADAARPDSSSSDSTAAGESFSKDLVEAVNFYEGALIAVDSLRKAGNDVTLKVIDLPGDEEKQRTKLWLQKYDNVQMVFSTLNGKSLKTLSEILGVRKIPLISCEANTYSFVEKNPYAICIQPSSLTQCRMMGTFAEKKFKGDNFIILSSNSDKEKERNAAFISGFADTAAVSHIKKVPFITGDTLTVTKSLSAVYTNTIFIPSTDEDFVTSVYSLLESYQGLYRFRIIGLPVWQYFETLDLRVLEKYSTMIFATEYYSYDEPNTLLFRKKFRMRLSTEPGDEAYLGYDAFLQFGNLLLHNHLPLDMPEMNLRGLRSVYSFQKNTLAAAESHYINVLKIENFRYVKLNEN